MVEGERRRSDSVRPPTKPGKAQPEIPGKARLIHSVFLQVSRFGRVDRQKPNDESFHSKALVGFAQVFNGTGSGKASCAAGEKEYEGPER